MACMATGHAHAGPLAFQSHILRGTEESQKAASSPHEKLGPEAFKHGFDAGAIIRASHSEQDMANWAFGLPVSVTPTASSLDARISCMGLRRGVVSMPAWRQCDLHGHTGGHPPRCPHGDNASCMAIQGATRLTMMPSGTRWLQPRTLPLPSRF